MSSTWFCNLTCLEMCCLEMSPIVVGMQHANTAVMMMRTGWDVDGNKIDDS